MTKRVYKRKSKAVENVKGQKKLVDMWSPPKIRKVTQEDSSEESPPMKIVQTTSEGSPSSSISEDVVLDPSPKFVVHVETEVGPSTTEKTEDEVLDVIEKSSNHNSSEERDSMVESETDSNNVVTLQEDTIVDDSEKETNEIPLETNSSTVTMENELETVQPSVESSKQVDESSPIQRSPIQTQHVTFTDMEDDDLFNDHSFDKYFKSPAKNLTSHFDSSNEEMRRLNNESFLKEINEIADEGKREQEKLRKSLALNELIEAEQNRNISQEVENMTMEEQRITLSKSFGEDMASILTMDHEMLYKEFLFSMTYSMLESTMERYFLFDFKSIVKRSTKSDDSFDKLKSEIMEYRDMYRKHDEYGFNANIARAIKNRFIYKTVVEENLEEFNILEDQSVAEYEKLFSNVGIHMVQPETNDSIKNGGLGNLIIPEEFISVSADIWKTTHRFVNILFSKFIRDITKQVNNKQIQQNDLEKVLAFLIHVQLGKTFHSPQIVAYNPPNIFAGESQHKIEARDKIHKEILDSETTLRRNFSEWNPLKNYDYESGNLMALVCDCLKGSFGGVIRMILHRYRLQSATDCMKPKDMTIEDLKKKIQNLFPPSLIAFVSRTIEWSNVSVAYGMVFRRIFFAILIHSVNIPDFDMEKLYGDKFEEDVACLTNVLRSSLKFISAMALQCKRIEVPDKKLATHNRFFYLYYIESVIYLIGACYSERCRTKGSPFMNETLKSFCAEQFKIVLESLNSVLDQNTFILFTANIDAITKCIYNPFSTTSLDFGPKEKKQQTITSMISPSRLKKREVDLSSESEEE